ncbi:MAG TPA: hypothetical protein VHX61_15695 [Rhizomicrobium sp.]|nr:hypothetical protein [Rhizomicrobium sp.]
MIQRTLPPQIGGSSQRTRVPTRPERVLHPEEIKPESGEVRSGLIFSIVFGWFVFVFIGLAVLMRVNDATPRLPPPPAEKSFPAPRLDTLPNALLAPYLATQRRRLTNSAIPITRAMMEIAKRPDPYAPIAAGEDSSGH